MTRRRNANGQNAAAWFAGQSFTSADREPVRTVEREPALPVGEEWCPHCGCGSRNFAHLESCPTRKAKHALDVLAAAAELRANVRRAVVAGGTESVTTLSTAAEPSVVEDFGTAPDPVPPAGGE